MRKTFRDKKNLDYWTLRWSSINEDKPMQNADEYPLKYANMIIDNKKEKILEAGCGAGRILRYYHEKNFDIIGIDFISEAINKLKDADQSLKVECGNILNLNFKDEYFDKILAFGLYHNFHSEELKKSINETYRVLKKGGKICASFRADNVQEFIIDWINQDKQLINKEFHKLNLKKKEFISLFQNNGFKIDKVFSVQNMPFLYKFSFFRSTDHKKFDENKARIEGYKLSVLGNFIQNLLFKFFPDSFCNVYLLIGVKK